MPDTFEATVVGPTIALIDDVEFADGTSVTRAAPPDDGTTADTVVHTAGPSTATTTGFQATEPQILYALGYDSPDKGGLFDGVILVMEPILDLHGLEIWRRDVTTEDSFKLLGTAAFAVLIYERDRKSVV